MEGNALVLLQAMIGAGLIWYPTNMGPLVCLVYLLVNYCSHMFVGRVGEPMVYTVDVNGPVEDVYQAIQRAVNTPVGQYEPPEMRYENVQQRLLDYLEVDWEVFAQGKQRRGTVPNNLSIEDWQRDWIKRNPDSEISPLE